MVLTMTQVRREHRHLTVACDLEAAGAEARVAEWQALRDAYELGAETIPGGARMWLATDAAPLAESLVRREAGCCGFLDFDMATEDGRVRLDITSPAPQGAQVAVFLAGLNRDPPS